MGAVEEYRERREARKAERKRERIEDYRERRAIRLLERGLMPVEYRADAPDDDGGNNNNNNGGGGEKGGHGNTRLPFGLCMRYGITIEPGWGPGDAWEALKGVGIEAKKAYEKLKRGGDPGTPEPEPPKDPVKSVRVRTRSGTDVEYNKLEGKKLTWTSRGDAPWRLYGDRVGDFEEMGWRAPARRMSESFFTKTDMFRWLKDKGVEEFADPETGEIVNPKEMEIPRAVLVDRKRGYTDISIGMRDGMYTIIGTDYDGKKKKIDDFSSLAAAKGFLEGKGVAESDIKLSPAIKKREKERLSWLSSPKKEYFEVNGKKYGDIHITPGYRSWSIYGEGEDGDKEVKTFETRAEMMKYLKDNGVEVVREGKTVINPQDEVIPEARVTIKGRPFQDAGLEVDRYGDVSFYAVDMDGQKMKPTHKRDWETLGAFKQRIAESYGVTEDQLTIPDESKEKFAEIEKAEEEKEKKRKEFEAKAIQIEPGRKYADIEVVAEGAGYGDDYKIIGYDRDGERRSLTYSGDFYDMEEKMKEWGLDINEFIKNDDIRRKYDEYRKGVQEFESKAVDFAGDKYVDVSVEWDRWDGFTLYGTDSRGRKREIGSAESYEEFEKLVSQYGYSPDSFPFDEESKKRKEKAFKAKEALATGEYHSLEKKDSAYKDIRIEEDPSIGGWKVMGTDVDGNEEEVYQFDTWDEAIQRMGEFGVTDYKVKDKDGTEMSKPKWGMHKVTLMKKPGGGFLVFADSERYGEHAIMYETPFEHEARQWLKDNGVPERTVKTRGMNPNDDVPRTHTCVSLKNFDKHRSDKEEDYGMLKDMDDGTKRETADMLTEMFDKGAYRINRTDHFTEIVLGKFKNLLETGTSRGSSAKEGRRVTGVKTFGHEYDIKPSDAENYGYWGIEDDAESLATSPASGYGAIQFKFKKDRVGDRVTYTFGDTLDSFGGWTGDRPLAGYAGSHPTIEGVSALDGGGSGLSRLEELREHYKKYKRGEISFSTFHKLLSRRCPDGYVECQFHGKLTIDDVESITMSARTFDRTFGSMTPETRQKVMTRIKDAGIMFRVEDGGTMHDAFERFKRLYGGGV